MPPRAKTNKKNVKLISELRDHSTAYQYGSVKADQRVQVKMPQRIVELLDKHFPDIDRSSAITQFVIQGLIEELQYSENDKDLKDLEQDQLDSLWDYLEYRDNS